MTKKLDPGSREAASIVASSVSTYSPSFIRYRANRIERKQAEVAERDRLVAQARADLTADQDGWHQPTVDAVLVSMADAGWRPQEKAE